MTNSSIEKAIDKKDHFNFSEYNALLLSSIFMAMSATVNGQNQEQDKTSNREKTASKIEKLKSGISATLITEAEGQYGKNSQQTAQAMTILKMNTEIGNLFAGIETTGCLSNCSDDNNFSVICTEFLIKAGIKLDGGEIKLSTGKIPMLSDYASTSNLTNMASIGNTNICLGNLATANSAIMIDYTKDNGDKIALGYIEEGPIFTFKNKQGKFVLMGAKKYS